MSHSNYSTDTSFTTEELVNLDKDLANEIAEIEQTREIVSDLMATRLKLENAPEEQHETLERRIEILELRLHRAREGI